MFTMFDNPFADQPTDPKPDKAAQNAPKRTASEEKQTDGAYLAPKQITGAPLADDEANKRGSQMKNAHGIRIDFNAVKQSVQISQYLADRGMEIQSGNRFNATWRGGDSFSCSFDDGKWCDHKTNEGGSVLDLAMQLEGFASARNAADALAQRYGLSPSPHFNGKAQSTEYIYRDENGAELFRVVRKVPKGFIQYHRDATGAAVWKMDGVRRVPYHLDELTKAVSSGRDIFIAEGEKDVDTMRRLGFCATCNPGGAGKWLNEYSQYFNGARGKVTIIADRDPKEKNYPGQRHAFAVKKSLALYGVTAKVVYVPDGKGKDATDYANTGATAADFAALADGDEITPPWSDERKSATTANATPSNVITNYVEEMGKDGKGKDVKIRLARTQAEIRADLFNATKNWPRKVGGCVFAFQPSKVSGDQRYLAIRKPPALFSWIRDTLTPRWKSGNGGAQDDRGTNYVTMEQLYESISATAITYQGISRAPHFPPRQDQFYDYGELPPPSKDHHVFWELIDFFCLANDTYRTLAAAFFVAPMYYGVSADETLGAMPKPMPRPLWLIDTVDAQGSGKSTLAKKVALLYGSDILDVTMGQLKNDATQVLKRILSVEGRGKRVFLIDNVTGTIKDATLASWVTASTLSGLAPYGRGEETRANDFTWCITVNGAELDTDTASRAYTVKVRKRDTEYVARTFDEHGTPRQWEADVDYYIFCNRLQLYADVLDMLENAKPRRSGSRFPDFDARVLSAVCRTDDEFVACRASIEADANGANVDAELVENFTEAVERYLAELPKKISGYDATIPTMISHAVINEITKTTGGKFAELPIKQIRTLLKAGLTSKFSRRFQRLRSSYKWRKESIVYGLHLIPNDAAETEYQTLDLVPYQGLMRPDVQRQAERVKVATIQ